MRLIFLYFIFFLPLQIFSQNYTLFGYISDQQTGEKLIGAGVSAPAIGKGVSTNAQGYYSLTLPNGKEQLIVSYPGYKRLTLDFSLSKDTLLSFALESTSIIKEVEIVSSQSINNDRPNAISLPIKQIKALPALGGEVDVIKAIQRLPGIKSGNEGTTGLYVRGGTPDQNLILLDGIPVYNISHLFGFVSIFNASSISHLEVIKGGFPARYGGRLASVIDVHTKDGNLKSWHGELEAGVVSSKIFVEGPLKKDISSISMSARRSFYEAYTLPRTWIKKDGEFNSPNFYDFNIKVNYKLSERDKIMFSSYLGRDALNLERSDTEDTIRDVNNRVLKWGNTINCLRWNRLWGERLFSNISLYSNFYSYTLGSDRKAISTINQNVLSQRLFNFSSKINDFGAILDFNYYPNPQHALKFGGSVISHLFKPGFSSTKIAAIDQPLLIDTSNNVVGITAFEARAYLEDNYKISSKFIANIGVHGSLFNVRGKQYSSLEPRLFLTYNSNKKWNLSAGFTTMQQYLHLLANSGLGIPADLWVPPTDKVAPQKSWQASVGWNSKTGTGWELSIDAYYKEMSNLIDYKPGSSFLIEGADWEKKVALNGTGTSKGIELFVRKTSGMFTGMAGYTLAWTDRSFLDIDNGKRFPFRYDRRHDFQISGSYTLTKKIALNAAWTFSSGNPVTLPVAIYPSLIYPPTPNTFRGIATNDIIDVDLPIGHEGVFQEGTINLYYGTKNNQQMPAYHRLDLSIQFNKKKRHGERVWSFQVYNAYNRINPYYIRYSYTGRSNDPLDSKGEFQVVSLFQIIPSVSYAYKF